ncbi:hypothetical protein [Chitinophaga solisilvae]|uniref:hypothetical protein n=1 Tax=Chitinophaga solisilvae TaxID=1233460 RepID=UPI00137195D6|nr:hypothetical protein [Chitinophaga solisilvae]
MPTTDNEKDKAKKTDNTHFVLSMSMPKSKLGLDAGYRYSGSITSDFRFNTNNAVNAAPTVNFKSVVTYTKGNVTYVLPYNVQMPQPGNTNFQKLQIILPLKKG